MSIIKGHFLAQDQQQMRYNWNMVHWVCANPYFPNTQITTVDLIWCWSSPTSSLGFTWSYPGCYPLGLPPVLCLSSLIWTYPLLCLTLPYWNLASVWPDIASWILTWYLRYMTWSPRNLKITHAPHLVQSPVLQLGHLSGTEQCATTSFHVTLIVHR